MMDFGNGVNVDELHPSNAAFITTIASVSYDLASRINRLEGDPAFIKSIMRPFPNKFWCPVSSWHELEWSQVA